MLLSIGLMVKNEEKYLEQCLSSLLPVLEKIDSELIIVDTGSTDNTVEIAKRYTDKVYYHSWTNNFGEMRNIVLSYAKGEWFFFLDGDEVLEDPSGVIDFFTSNKHKKFNCAGISMKNFFKSDNPDSYGLFHALRLFRNDKDFYFKGIIHEQPQAKGPAAKLDGLIIHYGYINDDKELMEYKYKRNVELIKKVLEETPDDIYHLFQLSQSYAMHGEYKKALEPIEKAYELAKAKELKRYMYVLTHLAKSYFNNKEYHKVIEITQKGNKLRKGYIDLYFYQALAEFELGRLEDSIQSFTQYLYWVDQFHNGKGVIDFSVSHTSVSNHEDAKAALCSILTKLGDYEEALKYGKQVSSPKAVKETIPHLTSIYFKLEQYDELKKLLKKWDDDINLSDVIINSIENQYLNLGEQERKTLAELFSDKSTDYGVLNCIRYDNLNETELYSDLINKGELDLSAKGIHYGEFLLYFIRKNLPISQLLLDVKDHRIIGFCKYILHCYSEQKDLLLNYACDDELWVGADKHEVLRIRTLVLYSLLQDDKLAENVYRNIFDLYIKNGIQFVSLSYQSFIIDNLRVSWTRSNSDGFLLYMKAALEHEKSSPEYIRLLRLALRQDEVMKRGIEFLLEDVNNQLSNQSVMEELELHKETILSTIKDALNTGTFDLARDLIDEYEDIVGLDASICSAKAIVLMVENRFEEAEAVLQRGLELEPNNADLLFNMGYLNETQNNLTRASQYYKHARMSTDDRELHKELDELISQLDKKVKSIEVVSEHVSSDRDYKLAFFIETPLHYYVYKSVMDELDIRGLPYEIVLNDATMRVDSRVTNMFHRTSVFVNQVIKDTKINLLSEVLTSHKKYDVLYSVAYIGDVMLPVAKHHFRMMYGLAKEVYGYGWWNIYYDRVFCYGQHDYERVNIFDTGRMVGNPKLDGFFQKKVDREIVISNLNLDKNKKTVLYAPTYGDLSSIDKWTDAIASLQSQYNVIVKLHHRTAYIEKARYARIKSRFTSVVDDTFDPVDLWTVCEVLISDNSGIVYEGILVDADIILLDTELSSRHVLTNDNSIDQMIKQELGSISRTNELLPLLSNKEFWTAQKQVRANLRNQFFEFDDGLSGQRVVDETLHFLNTKNKRPENFYLNNLRERITQTK